jgi:hypothetical protein
VGTIAGCDFLLFGYGRKAVYIRNIQHY